MNQKNKRKYNSEFIKSWIQYANADLDVAKRLFNSPRPNKWTYILILWHSHQVIEKMLKMIALNNKKELLKIHDLPRLYEQAEIKDFPEEYEKILFKLNKYYISPRYPNVSLKNPYPASNKKIAAYYLETTNKIFLSK